MIRPGIDLSRDESIALCVAAAAFLTIEAPRTGEERLAEVDLNRAGAKLAEAMGADWETLKAKARARHTRAAG